MRQKLSALPAPVLAGVVRAHNGGEAKAEIRNCFLHGADMIDLHLSCLEKDDEMTLKAVIDFSPLPVLALHYNNSREGKALGLGEDERTASLLRAARAGAAGVDMQGYTFDAPSKTAFRGEDRFSFTGNGPKEVVTDPAVIEKQMEFIERIHAEGAEVLLSCHPGIYLNRDQVTELALFLEKRGPDLIKIVTVAHDEAELLESFAAMSQLKKEVRVPVAYHASGKAGLLSRIINPVLGGHIAFCVDRFREGDTMEQVDLSAARHTVDSLKLLMRQ